MVEVTLDIHECVYTSAVQLLAQGAGHLGVVARSVGFPRELESELSSLSGYTLLPQLPTSNPAVHPNRYVLALRGPAKNRYCVSRTVFAGADHTGRTTPLAHHIVFETAAIASAGLRYCDLLASIENHFERRWDKPPQEFNPPRKITVQTDQVAKPLSRVWSDPKFRDQAPELAEAMLQFSVNRRPIVFVVDPVAESVDLAGISTLIELLPPSMQASTCIVSHVVSPSDFVREAAILFTYRDSGFHTQCVRRQDPQAPIVIDVQNPSHNNSQRSGDFAAALRQYGEQDGEVRFRELLAGWDDLKLRPQDSAIFRRYLDLRSSAAAVHVPADIARLGAKFSSLRDGPAIIAAIEAVAAGALNKSVAGMADEAREASLRSICADERWPVRARETAADRLIEVASLVGLIRSADKTQPSVVLDAVKRSLSADPASADFVFESLPPQDAASLSRLISAARPSLSRACGWAAQRVQNDQHNAPSMKALTSWIAKSAKDPDDLAKYRPAGCDPALYVEHVIKPVLAEKFRSGSGRDAGVFADELIRLSLSDGSIGKAVQDIRSQQAFQITPSVRERWVKIAERSGQHHALAQAIGSLGVATIAEPVESIPTGSWPSQSLEHSSHPPFIPRRTRSAGPRQTSRGLALILIAACSIYTVVHLSEWQRYPLALGGIAVLYILADLILSAAWSDGWSMSPLRYFRQICALLLLAGCSWMGYRLWTERGLVLSHFRPATPSTQPTTQSATRRSV